MNEELITIVTDELDVFLRDRGMFIGREDLEELADIVVNIVSSYDSFEENDEDDSDDDFWNLEAV